MSARTAAGQDVDAVPAPRTIRVFVRGDWSSRDRRGLLSSDARVRTLRKVLATYPDVRHILPDRISLEAATEARTLETVARFLERQHWLVKSVAIE
ncbi:MAG: hypothetical protein HYU51_04345 [Candidatus Rokubacteria bacterium]|nr:hypothetical protein [Candidatus Rokubacteria bacterium]